MTKEFSGRLPTFPSDSDGRLYFAFLRCAPGYLQASSYNPTFPKMSSASAWASPATRTELIENLVSGVGGWASFRDLACTHLIIRSVQSFERRYPGGLPLPPNPQRGIRLLGQPCYPQAVSNIHSSAFTDILNLYLMQLPIQP